MTNQGAQYRGWATAFGGRAGRAAEGAAEAAAGCMVEGVAGGKAWGAAVSPVQPERCWVGWLGHFSGILIATYFIAAYASIAWATACFDDKKLAQLGLQQPQGALVYVWSPRMALSAQHAVSAQRQALLRGLAFVPLHDAKVGHAEIQSALAQLAGLGGAPLAASAQALASSQSLCAASLEARDALRHFPTAFVMQGALLHRHAIIGAMPEAAWAHSIALRLHSSQDGP